MYVMFKMCFWQAAHNWGWFFQTALSSHYIIAPRTISPSKQSKKSDTLPTGKILLHHCPPGTAPRRGCSALELVIVYSWVVPTYWTRPSVNRIWDFSSSASWLQGTPPEAMVAGWERKGKEAAVGTMGSQATSLYNFHVPSGPAQATST